MTWQPTIYLTFPSEGLFQPIVETATYDIIGTIVHEDGTPSEGFHVNVRLPENVEVPSEWIQYQIYPKEPERVFAGDV